MNWYEIVTYLVLFLMFLAGIRVVTTSNVIHAAISLVLALALSAALFLLLSADFVAWVLVLVYIGAVIVLFLFGIMITRAPLGVNAELDNEKKLTPALVSIGIFSLDNIIFSPHNAALTIECRKRMSIESCMNVFNYLHDNNNLNKKNIVNLSKLNL